MTFPDIAHYFCWLPTCAHGFEPCERINNNGQMKSRRGTQKTRTSALPHGVDKMVWEGKKPLTRPATAGESAVAGHPLPKGEGY
jgi:hypothetical protein